MAARTLSIRTALPVTLDEVRFTLSRFQAHPLGAPFVPIFQAIRNNWTTTYEKQLSLQEKLVDCRANVSVCDDACDDFAGRFSKAILTLVHDDRKHPLWTHYFGNKTLSAFRRPVLASQLKAMEAWIPSLQTSPHPTLKAMAPELEALMTRAKQAVTERDATRQALKQFNNIGERKQFIDQLNGARKKAHGELAQIAHETVGLPSDFADRFFLSESSTNEDETSEALRDQVAELKEQLAEAEAKLAKAEEREAEAKKAEEEQKQAEVELAALAAVEADIAKKKAALLAQLQR